MILVSKPEKPFDYTPKGNPRRHVVTAAYEAEINAAYKLVKDSSQDTITPPENWSLGCSLDFIRNVVHKVTLNKRLTDDADLFANGCDRYVKLKL